MPIASTLLTLVLPCLLLPVAAAPQMTKNPLFPGADPDAVVIGDTVWIYPTFSNSREQQFFAFSSKDLVTWKRSGPVLRFKGIAWINADGQKNHGAWAPTVAPKNGKFYFYYSVGDQNVTPSRIGVAVGDSPAGPFKDSGKAMDIVGAKNVFEAIDPMVFTDPKGWQKLSLRRRQQRREAARLRTQTRHD